jgi:hypothetical protein
MSGLSPEIKLEGRPLAIFPCRNKKPACLHGFYDAVSDPDAIADLFRRYPRARQIGIATGAINDLDILDIDPRKGGDKWFEENRHRIPQTRTHQTPSGGLHLLFHHAPGLRSSRDRVAKGVDVRADGAMAVWWPAQFYPVHDAPVAEWPDWLLELARQKQHRHTVPFPMKTGEDGPLVVWQTSGDYRTIPKPLYSKMLALMPKARGHHQRRVRGILSRVVEKQEGRNDALNIAAYCLRELIDAGAITYAAAESLLIEAATFNGYIAKDGFCAAIATIRSGLGPQITSGPSSLDEEENAP